MLEEDCGRHVLTQVCLELPWDSVKWWVCAVYHKHLWSCHSGNNKALLSYLLNKPSISSRVILFMHRDIAMLPIGKHNLFWKVQVPNSQNCLRMEQIKTRCEHRNEPSSEEAS